VIQDLSVRERMAAEWRSQLALARQRLASQRSIKTEPGPSQLCNPRLPRAPQDCRFVAHAAITERLSLPQLAGAKRQRVAGSASPGVRSVVRRTPAQNTVGRTRVGRHGDGPDGRGMSCFRGARLLVRLNGLAAAFLQPFGKHELHALDEREHQRRAESRAKPRPRAT
jgi:hypothetical protein